MTQTHSLLGKVAPMLDRRRCRFRVNAVLSLVSGFPRIAVDEGVVIGVKG